MGLVLFRHLRGSKINQTDQFNLDEVVELTLGRDPECSVAFDPNKDDVVSRRHALVRVLNTDKLHFTVEDLKSSNGTFLDGEKITAETELLPGQTIELGTGGPSMVFDVEPRPAHLMARTRMMKQPIGRETRVTEAPQPMNATRETAYSASPPPPPPPPPGSAPKSGVGRETVERMLGEERKATSRKWMYVVAGVLAVVAIGGGALYVSTSTKQEQIQQTATQQSKDIAAQVSEIGKNVAKMTPEQVAAAYSKSTVFIENVWRLYDQTSGRQVFHKVYEHDIDKDGRVDVLPAYVKMPDGSIVRWLTTEGKAGVDRPISKNSQGSGFVVTNDGFILTNKHVAAGWLVRYGYTPYEAETPVGVVVDMSAGAGKPAARPRGINPKEIPALWSWVPEDGAWLFHGDTAVPIYEGRKAALEGRSEILDVRFQGDANPAKARLIRSSQRADVSLIKVDAARPLQPVNLAPREHKSKLGEPIIVLGYPAITPEKFQQSVGYEGGVLRNRVERVPEPTVTAGYISNIGEGIVQQGENVTTVGTMGEVYQLSDLATGSGNSGGPVFNGNGEVIGLFTYSLKENEVRTTFAVPIKYAHQIL